MSIRLDGMRDGSKGLEPLKFANKFAQEEYDSGYLAGMERAEANKKAAKLRAAERAREEYEDFMKAQAEREGIHE